ncbi:MAG: RraA family protein [Alphaproteobacteria bacterium]|nr:RraA family protein [Alphaproteobacteria bacterium]
MALQRYRTNFQRLAVDKLDAWRKIPPAVASDCMNRTQSMQARIKPVAAGLSLCGQARTVQVMAGDCLPICEAIATAAPGEILVVDAGGVEDTAVWGGVMTFEAVLRKIGGAIIDGAVRDVAEIRSSGLPMFCRAAVPRGPHHGFGGVVDGRLSVAGATVAPGDVVLANDDGVVVVPLDMSDQILALSQAHLAKEESWIAGLKSGRSIKEIFGFPEPSILR